MRASEMTAPDRRLSEIFAEEGSRLRRFIRRRVSNEADVEDLLQEVFAELVEANRLLMPIEHVTAWLFRVARNRITDLFRKKRPDSFDDAEIESSGSRTCCRRPTRGRTRRTCAGSSSRS
jgi:RNA polymerase sigma factor (sigma-70 family)